MTARTRATVVGAAGLVVSSCLGIGCRRQADVAVESPPVSQSGDGAAHVVTAISGESWIKHLGVSLDATRMGQMGGSGPSFGYAGP